MSWGEVYKINNNMKKPLNEQLRDMTYQMGRIVTASTTYTPEKTGLYRIICVGKGGDGTAKSTSSANPRAYAGGGGGVAVKTMRLLSSSSYEITVGSTASFAAGTTILTATSGTASGDGGTASGGDYNFSGTEGKTTTSMFAVPAPGSVGVVIMGLTNTPAPATNTLIDTSPSGENEVYCLSFPYGDSVLNYGGGGTGAGFYKSANTTSSGGYSTTGKPAAVIIIPLELEE